MSLSLGTPAHAPHLPPVDVDAIVGQDIQYEPINAPIRHQTLVFSTSTCRPFQEMNIGDVLKASLRDITGHQVNLDNLFNQVTSALDKEKRVNLVTFGPPTQVTAMQKALDEGGFNLDSLISSSGDTATTSHKIPPRSTQRDGSNLIAIVGQSYRFPGSDDRSSFWATLEKGEHIESEVPASRFDLSAYYDATGSTRNTMTARYGSFMDQPGLFDARLFNVSPREARIMDPVQRLLLMCSYEALQLAGYSPDASPSTRRMRVATYFAQSGDDWRQARADQEDVDIYYIPGTFRAFGPGRLNYHYKWGQGNYSVDSACAGSSTSILMACKALLARDCDMALAGGGHLNIAPEPFVGLSRAGFLCDTPGGCKAFRADADGYSRGEGVGLVVLKRLEDAIADNDNIAAVISGSGRNYSWDATSITHPSSAAQSKLLREVLCQAGVTPDDVGFVEMHGTGTEAGDGTEGQTVANVFGTRHDENPLFLGAIKANMGHSEAAAGIASLAKAVEMLQHNAIPAQPGFPLPEEAINPFFIDLARSKNIRVADKLQPFLPPQVEDGHDGKRRIIVNNFDASGGNNCLLVEDAPGRNSKSAASDPREVCAVTVSARTTKSLKGNIERLLSYLESHPTTHVADIAYTTTARRIHEDLRKSYTVSSTKDLKELLKADLAKSKAFPSEPTGPHSLVFAFTGQGAQYAGMGKQLFETCEPFRKSIEKLHNLCLWQQFPAFIELITKSDVTSDTYSSVQQQLATVALEMALVDLWSTWGIKPDFVVGYSLGEYAALYAAGVLSAHDTLFLVGHRAKLMEERCTRGSHLMLAVQATVEDAEKFIRLGGYTSCEVACKSAPKSTVVSGPAKEIEGLRDDLKAMGGVTCTLLNVPYGFHCTHVDPILDDFADLAESVCFQKPKVPVVSSLLGEVVDNQGVFDANYLARQAREPVNFVAALRVIDSRSDHGAEKKRGLWLEIGPKRVLNTLVKATLGVEPARLLHSIESKDSNWSTAIATLATLHTEGCSVKWHIVHRPFEKFLTLLELPTYAFDTKDFWIQPKASQKAAASEPGKSKVLEPEIPGFPSTTLQRFIREDKTLSLTQFVFESILSHPPLLALAHGHHVGGTALTPASAFMDMAYTAAHYVYHRTNSKNSAGGVNGITTKTPAMSMENLSITHPLMPKPQGAQDNTIITTTVQKTSNPREVIVSFASREGNKASQDHGGCTITFETEDDWDVEWSRTSHFVKAAKNALVNDPKTHHLPRSIVYKLFASLVDYDAAFQGMETVYVAPDFKGDVTARITLPNSVNNNVNQAEFLVNPYWSDAVIQASGFLLNGNPGLAASECFLFTGVDEMKLKHERLRTGGSYESYIHLTETVDSQTQARGGHAKGDVYIFEGEEIIGVVKGFVFQHLTRRVLGTILGSGANGVSPEPAQISSSSMATTSTVPPSPKKQSNGGHANNTSPAFPQSSEKAITANLVIDIVLEQTGFDREDMLPSTRFADMGLDSLCTIEVVGIVREKTGLDLASAFFNHNATVAQALRALGASAEPAVSEESSAGQVDSDTANDDNLSEGSAPSSSITTQPSEPELEVEDLSKHHCEFFLMQGSSSSTKTPLFFLPDGTGYPSVILKLPPVFPNQADNPFFTCKSPLLAHTQQLQQGREVMCTIEGLSQAYASAIRRARPRGPYILAAYSLGCTYAFEVAKILRREGETVAGLILVDFNMKKSVDADTRATRPVPRDITAAGEDTMRMQGIEFPAMGISMPAAPPGIRCHMVSVFKSLQWYHPTPMTEDEQPLKTFVLWAGKGIEDSKSNNLTHIEAESSLLK